MFNIAKEVHFNLVVGFRVYLKFVLLCVISLSSIDDSLAAPTCEMLFKVAGKEQVDDSFEEMENASPKDVLGDQEAWFERYYQLTSDIYTSFPDIQNRLEQLSDSDESYYDESQPIDDLLPQIPLSICNAPIIALCL